MVPPEFPSCSCHWRPLSSDALAYAAVFPLRIRHGEEFEEVDGGIEAHSPAPAINAGQERSARLSKPLHHAEMLEGFFDGRALFQGAGFFAIVAKTVGGLADRQTV